MFICLSKNSFIRRYEETGYINNQLTKLDRTYNDSGTEFLFQIKRYPRKDEDIIDDLKVIFYDAEDEELRNDFRDFVGSLEEDLFIVTGNTQEELDKKESVFRYSSKFVKAKFTTRSYLDPEKDIGAFDTQNYLADKFKKKPTMVDLQFEITSKCNERCLHCYLPPGRDQGNIDTALCLDTLDQLAEMNALSVTFTGGEPMLHPDLPKFLERARKNDFIITVLSNATMLNEEILDSIKKSNINQIQISVYSLKSEEHDHITQIPGSFHKTMKSIELFFENDIPIQISCPVMKTNYRSYRDVLKWAYGKGVKAYTDYIMNARTDFSKENLKERLSIQETEELLTDIVGYDENYKDMVDERAIEVEKGIPSRRKPDNEVCGVGRSYLCLASNGALYPCSGWQGMVVGNVMNDKLKDIWEKSTVLNHLRNITLSSFPECLKCEDFDFCAMCMARNYNESGGDQFKVNRHFCDAAKLNRKIVKEHLGNKG